jgi:GT2 family glycosyltransferase
MGANGVVGVAARPVLVTGVLVVHDGARWLKGCLDALSRQTRPLDRLIVVDTRSTDDSPRIVAKHARIRQVVGEVTVLPAPRGSTFGDAVRRAVDQLAGVPAELADLRAEWLWLLHDDSAASPQALAELLDVARRSPSVGVAGPKLVDWEDPTRLLEVGSVITRSGRRVGGPAAGEPDQGQYDHRNDVLGVSTSGMLVRRDVFHTLGGFDPAFGQFGDDLDFCWRAQLAGHRVVVAPRARLREAAASTNGRRSPDLSAEAARRRDRRHGRHVALARCSLYAAPVLAIWIALTSLGSAVVLLLAKRPTAAWAALGDLRSVLTPWRPIAARWRSRGLRQVRRRDLRGLFASPRAGFSRALDEIFDAMGGGSARSIDDGALTAQSMESGPTSEDAESLEGAARGTGWRVLRHPGFLAVMASTLLAGVAFRSLLGTLSPGGTGIAGGELLPVTSDASQLWHGWLDGWHGPGLGNDLESAPYLAVLSAASWVFEHLPFIGASTSSVSVLTAWLLAAAIPASAWTAYLAARVVTGTAWPRAWAALAWASLATLTTAVGGGRLGAVVAHLLLPLVGAGFVCAARRFSSSSATFGAAAALALTSVFNPALGVCGAVAALVLLALGHGRARLRAAVLLLAPIGLLGPWILQLVDHPLLLLGGPGLTQWRGGAAAPWHLELLHPGGPGSYPVLLSAPIVLAGLIAMLRREAGSRSMTVLAILTGTGLALGVAAPLVVIATVPQDVTGAGGPITAWAGTGLDLAAMALIAAAVRGCVSGPGRRLFSHFAVRHILVSSVETAAVLAVVTSMVAVGWFGIGQEVGAQVPNTPAVAADQARGAAGNRLLVITRKGTTISYHLVGAEPGPVVRDVPRGAAADPALAAAVRRLVGGSDVTSANGARDGLADLAVGFVAFQGASTEPLAIELDATAGLTRLSNNRGLILWRVLPREKGVSSSRLRLEDANGVPLASIAVTGDHGRTDVRVGPATPGAATQGRRLVVAEPAQWARHARVTFAERPLSAIAGAQQPTYLVPSGAGRLSVTLLPTYPWWRWGQLGLLLVVLFLAAPWGATRGAKER